jgi:hypothetical protein
MIPRLDPADGTVSHLRVTIAAKMERRGRKRVIVDPRHYWRTEITQLGGAGQAVDLFTTDTDDRLSAAISNSHVLVADGGPATQRRVQTTQLAFVAPPPTVDSINVVTAVVDVPADRVDLVGRALRALDEPIESSVVRLVVGAAPDQAFDALPAPLVVPPARADPAALLKRALAATEQHTMVVFTDRPAEIARAAANLAFKRPLHVVHVTGPAPRGWSRVLGKQRPDARAVERTGGIWIELSTSGAPLDTLWGHLIAPRFLDDVELTLNGAPFRPDGYRATAFETPGQAWSKSPPSSIALGSDFLGMLVSDGSSPGTSRPEHWEVTGLAWNKRLRFSTDATEPGYVAVRNLRVSPALGALPAPYRSAMEAELSQINDVLPGRPQAYVAP